MLNISDAAIGNRQKQATPMSDGNRKTAVAVLLPAFLGIYMRFTPPFPQWPRCRTR